MAKWHEKLADWTTSIFLPPFPEPNVIPPLRIHQQRQQHFCLDSAQAKVHTLRSECFFFFPKTLSTSGKAVVFLPHVSASSESPAWWCPEQEPAHYEFES